MKEETKIHLLLCILLRVLFRRLVKLFAVFLKQGHGLGIDGAILVRLLQHLVQLMDDTLNESLSTYQSLLGRSCFTFPNTSLICVCGDQLADNISSHTLPVQGDMVRELLNEIRDEGNSLTVLTIDIGMKDLCLKLDLRVLERVICGRRKQSAPVRREVAREEGREKKGRE